MTDKIALGRQGEIYVLQKLMDNGWKLPIDSHTICEGLDWVMEKNGRKIKIQVKTCKKKRIKFSVSRRTFDYLLVTDLKDVWIIPIELFNNTNVLNHTFRKTKGHYDLLNKVGLDLLSGINDCGIRYSEIDTVSPFFYYESSNINKSNVKLGGIHTRMNA